MASRIVSEWDETKAAIAEKEAAGQLSKMGEEEKVDQA